MKRVLSSASSNLPVRSVFASVKAPLTWPNSSLSNSVSDKPPIFTVIIACDARGETAWIARATRLFPVPFSPVIRTLASDGATRETISTTGRIAGDCAIKFGMVPRRSSFCASSFRSRRSAEASSICVFTMANNRWLSQGLVTKSRAPRFIASTANSTVAQAVITTIGRVLSICRILGMADKPSWPDVVSRA